MNNYGRIPGIFKWLFKRFIPVYDRDNYIFDLEEVYKNICKRNSRIKAYFWMFYQLLRSLNTFIKIQIHWSSGMFTNYLKIACRRVKRQKGYAFINIFGLSMGFVCFILIMLWVKDEFSYDNFHENRNEIYRVIQENLNDPGNSQSAIISTPNALAPVLEKEFPEIINYSRIWFQRNYLISYNENHYYEDNFCLVDPSLFDVFSFDFVRGDSKNPLKNPDNVIVTERIAKKYFGEEDPVGKILTMNRESDFVVSGVIKVPPANSIVDFDFFAPISFVNSERLQSWEWAVETFVLLEKDCSKNQVQEKISSTIINHNPETNYGVFLQPLNKIHLYQPLGEKGYILTVYMFLIVGIFIITIAGINYMNLATSKSAKRIVEIGIRKVVGANRFQLIKQFLIESVSLSIIAFLFALILIFIFIGKFNLITSKQIELLNSENIKFIIFLTFISICIGFLSGIYPSVYLSSFLPKRILQGDIKSGIKGKFFRRILVIIQFTVSVALIFGTLVISGQTDYLVNKNLGYSRDHIIHINMNSEMRNNYSTIKEELLTHTNIVNVTAASSLPTYVDNGIDIDWDGKTNEQNEDFTFFAMVDYDYFETLNIRLSEGRYFLKEYSQDINSYIINEEALKLMELENPIGKNISLGRQFPNFGQRGRIIGVVKNFHFRPLNEEIGSIVFGMNPRWLRRIMIKIKNSDFQETVEFIQGKLERHSPGFPVVIGFLDDDYNEMYMSEQQTGTILKYFTVIAIIISCLGLFGLTAYISEQRTKEIGVRKVMGASVSNIIKLLSREFIYLILLSNLIAFPIGYFLIKRWLQDFAYHTEIKIWFFIFSGLLIFIIAVFTVCFQSVKAATANPVDSLRNE